MLRKRVYLFISYALNYQKNKGMLGGIHTSGKSQRSWIHPSPGLLNGTWTTKALTGCVALSSLAVVFQTE